MSLDYRGLEEKLNCNLKRFETSALMHWEVKRVPAYFPFTGVIFEKEVTRSEISQKFPFGPGWPYSSVMIFNQDKELRYIWIHNLHAHFSVEDVLGKTDADWLSEEKAANLTAIRRQMLENWAGKRNNVHITIDGKLQFYDLTVEPLRDAAGDIIGITCAAT